MIRIDSDLLPSLQNNPLRAGPRNIPPLRLGLGLSRWQCQEHGPGTEVAVPGARSWYRLYLAYMILMSSNHFEKR